MDKRIEEYKKYERDLALYKKYKQFSRSKKSWDEFDDNDLLYLNEMDFERPETEYKEGMPTTLLWFDEDMRTLFCLVREKLLLRSTTLLFCIATSAVLLFGPFKQ